MNGLEAARRISGIAPSVPLLMSSLFKSEQLDKEAHDAGVDRVVSKTETRDLMGEVEGLARQRDNESYRA